MVRPRRWARWRARWAVGSIWLAGSWVGMVSRWVVRVLILCWAWVMAVRAAGMAAFLAAGVRVASRSSPRARWVSASSVLAARMAALAVSRAGLRTRAVR